jgi:hypothetical protein
LGQVGYLGTNEDSSNNTPVLNRAFYSLALRWPRGGSIWLFQWLVFRYRGLVLAHERNILQHGK